MQADGVVVALRHMTSDHGEFYAHKTSRKLVVVDDIVDIPKIYKLKAVVLPWHLISSRLLYDLYSRSIEIPPPGILAAVTPDRLNTLLEKISNKNVVSEKKTLRVDLCPNLPIGCHTFNNRVLMGNKAKTNEVRDAISSGSGLLVVTTHSDGIDADFGPAILCPMLQPIDNFSNFTCVRRSWCHRRSIPLSKIHSMNNMLSPHLIDTNILLFLACHSIMLSETHHPLVSPLLERILVNGNVNGSIAMWGIGFSNNKEVDVIANIIQSGASLCETMSQVAHLSFFKEHRIRLAIMGDPDLKNERPLENIDINYEGDNRINNKQAIPFLEAYLSGCDQVKINKELTLKLKNMTANHRIGFKHPIVRELFLDTIVAFGTMPIKFWYRDSVNLIPNSNKKKYCIYCGAQVASFKTVGLITREGRTVVSCPNCGITHDYTNTIGGVGIVLESETTVKVKTKIPREPFTAVLIIEYSKDKKCDKIMLPQYSSKGFSINLIGKLYPGTNVLCALLITTDGFSLARREIWFK